MLSLKGFLGLETSGWDAGLQKAKSRANSFASGISSTLAGAFTGGAIIAGIQKISDMIDHLANRAKEIKFGSQQLGMDPTTFQQFNNTVDATGLSPDKAGKALEKLAEVTEKIKAGKDTTGELVTAFAELGVTLDDIKRKDHRQIFFQIAEGMKDAEMTAKKLNALSATLGGPGPDLVPAFKLGFGSNTANAGILNASDLAELERLNKLSAELAGPWKDFGNEVLLAFSRIKVGLLSLPQLPKTLAYFASAGTYDPDAEDRKMSGLGSSLQKRLNEAQQEKAKRQAEAEVARQKQAEVAKIREGFEKRAEQIKAEVAAERFSMLTAQEKLRVLEAQAQVLREQKGTLESEMRVNGDPTGRIAADLAKNELDRVKNRRQRSDIQERLRPVENTFKDPANLNALQQIGARVNVKSDREATRAVQDLSRDVRELNQTIRQQLTQPQQGIQY